MMTEQEEQKMYEDGQKMVDSLDMLFPHILYITDFNTFEYTIGNIRNNLPEGYTEGILEGYTEGILEGNLIRLLLDVDGKEFFTISVINDDKHYEELLKDIMNNETLETSKRLTELEAMISICFQEDTYSVFDKDGNREQFLYTDLGQHIEETFNFYGDIKIKHVGECVIEEITEDNKLIWGS